MDFSSITLFSCLPDGTGQHCYQKVLRAHSAMFLNDCSQLDEFIAIRKKNFAAEWWEKPQTSLSGEDVGSSPAEACRCKLDRGLWRTTQAQCYIKLLFRVAWTFPTVPLAVSICSAEYQDLPHLTGKRLHATMAIISLAWCSAYM